MELELSDWKVKWAPWEYNTVVQSKLQAADNMENIPLTIIERSMPLRDHTFIKPSSPAKIIIKN